MKKTLSVSTIALLVFSMLTILGVEPVHASNLTLPTGGVVSVEFISSDAAYINDLSVVSPVNSFLFNTETTRRGTTVFLGSFAAGTVFEFEMLARTDGTLTWSSDPSKNIDGKDHVITSSIATDTWLMEWEDMENLGDQDFNDAVMVVRVGGDTDGDGLWDVWETNGVDVDWDGTIDLPIHQAPYNANPNHKDIFLEIDWMQDATHSHEPKAGVVNMVVDAFDDAPVPNPDGITGITLHVDVSNSITHHDHMRFDAPAGIVDFDTLKAANFDDKRRSVYHYCIFAHDLGFAKYYSGYAELPGNDFIVSFGEWHSGQGDIDGDGLDDEDVGTVMEQAGTLMHELGHNLDLHHGGGDDILYKPNFLSIMNYFFQMSGIQPTGRLDYSSEDLPDLDENSLDEFLGIQNGADDTAFYDPGGTQRQGQGTGSIDWDWDGTIEGVSGGSANVAVDINNDGAKTVLTGWDDWDNIRYFFTDTTDFEDGVHVSIDHVEMDFELSLLLRTPIADAGGPYESGEGTPITFDASGSADPDGDPLEYRWDFDTDEVWDTGWSSNPTAPYTWYDDLTGGTATVEVFDGLFTDTDTADVTVYNVPPTVDAGPDQIVYSGDTVSFSGSFTDPGTEDTHTIEWNFGDGTQATGILTPTHVYLVAQKYTVTLTVTDDDGGAGSDTLTITVQRIPVPIDIKPGSYPDSINPKSKGLIPVAILNDTSWTPYYIDPTLVDPSSAVFGPNKASPVRWAYEDVDLDGDIDLILFFKTQETGITEADTSATLDADLIDGRQITGVDSILTAPRKKP